MVGKLQEMKLLGWLRPLLAKWARSGKAKDRSRRVGQKRWKYSAQPGIGRGAAAAAYCRN
jgi:hypothetical protein